METEPTLEELKERRDRILNDPDSDPNPGDTLQLIDGLIERYQQLPPRGAMHRDQPPGSRLEIANAYAIGRLVDVNDFEELPELPLLGYVEPHEFHLLTRLVAFCVCGWTTELEPTVDSIALLGVRYLAHVDNIAG